MFDYPFKIERAFHVVFSVAGGTPVGVTPEGFRNVGYLGGGTVTGPEINGIVVPGGADWACLRPDGVLMINVNTMIKTDDEAIIQMTYTGVVDMGEDAYAKAAGGARRQGVYAPRSVPRLITAAEKYKWVNRRQFIGIGKLDAQPTGTTVPYDVYQII